MVFRKGRPLLNLTADDGSSRNFSCLVLVWEHAYVRSETDSTGYLFYVVVFLV